MRIFWIGKHPTSGEAGDEVFDRKTIAACRAQGHTVDLFYPSRVGRPREIVNLILGLPHHRARFASSTTVAAIVRRSASYDVAICSWEPLDVLARSLPLPVILILHNVTSRALPSMFLGSLVAAQGARQAGKWERRFYRANRFAAIAALSRRDLEYLRALEGRPKLILAPPGMPPCLRLTDDAPVLREVVISGTYDWHPKRRDLLAFTRNFSRLAEPGFSVRGDGLPLDATSRLRATPGPSHAENSGALRFGLITDRFEAGHKLKTLAYIASNQIVLSFADVAFDFVHIPDHELFIRQVGSVADIASHIDAVSAFPVAELRERLLRFQSACAQAFSWTAVATALLKAAHDVVSQPQEALAEPVR